MKDVIFDIIKVPKVMMEGDFTIVTRRPKYNIYSSGTGISKDLLIL